MQSVPTGSPERNIMQVTPLTKSQWKSVVVNSLFAFLSTFLPSVVFSPTINSAVLKSALVAGIMAAFKIVQKALTQE